MSRILPVSEAELSERIARNAQRLCAPYYQIDEIFQEPDAEWPGDKEGRALLAFVSHAQMTGKENPCMHPMVRALPAHLNEKGYLGKIIPEIFEQSLSGHSWMLRGLCAYYERYREPFAAKLLKGMVEGLYLPCAGRFSAYPLSRDHEEGAVSGTSVFVADGWLLSSDTCCAFMSIDGLSHYYALTRDERVYKLLCEMITVFSGIDKKKIKAQTHCSLTAARGALRMYQLTRETRFMEAAQAIFSLYTASGMTRTYQNYNWWGRPDSWTEPCAIVDSLMLAGDLYQITGDPVFRTIAARIFHNGFATLERPNGGAGPDSLVHETNSMLFVIMYEAFFCCTMRLAEGLLYVSTHREMLYAETEGRISRDAEGRYRDGDLLYAEVQDPALRAPDAVLMDGFFLQPIVKAYCLTEEQARKLCQRIVF